MARFAASASLLVQINKLKSNNKLRNLDISAQPHHYGLRRLWGWKQSQAAAERQAAGDSSVWPRGLSLQMAASRSASPPSFCSASLTTPEWLYDSSTIKPSANQPQIPGTDAHASVDEGLNRVRECLWVFPKGGSWLTADTNCRTVDKNDGCYVLFLEGEKSTVNVTLWDFGGSSSTLLLSVFNNIHNYHF